MDGRMKRFYELFLHALLGIFAFTALGIGVVAVVLAVQGALAGS